MARSRCSSVLLGDAYLADMIPYDLIIPSASRPHLLRPTLRTLLEHVDQLPERAILHDDAVFPGQQEKVINEFIQTVDDRIERFWNADDPPIGHGPALKWLLDQAQTEYVLYSQDDFETLRPLPIRQALTIMDHHGLHQIRFNKRATMA